MKSPDRFMLTFLDDATQALEKWDKYIQKQFSESAYSDSFYKDYYKGLGARSSDERSLQFLIYIELCRKYKIIPEDSSYKGTKRMDLAISIDNDDPENQGECGVELKWACFTKAGRLNQNTLNSFVDDFKKMKMALNKNKYMIQFGLAVTAIQTATLNNQIQELDGRMFRSLTPKAIKINTFPTVTDKGSTNFTLVLWSLNGQ